MRRGFFIKVGILGILAGFAFMIFTTSFMMNASEPRAILLYTQREKIPDIAFKISSVPLGLSSYLKFGEQRFAVMPATTDNIENALSQSEFVVIGTHGIDGMVVSDDRALIGPKKMMNSKMRSIYFGSCYFGTKRKAWEAMFPNAQVIGYDVETYKVTGWFYLFFKSWRDLLAIDFT